MISFRKQVYNVNDKPWETSESFGGMTKTIVEKELFSGGSLRIVKIQAHSQFNTHEHEFLQILYFTKGEGILTIDEELHPIEPGTTAIVFPNQCHSVQNTTDADLEIIVVESYNLPDTNTPYVDF